MCTEQSSEIIFILQEVFSLFIWTLLCFTSYMVSYLFNKIILLPSSWITEILQIREQPETTNNISALL